MKIFISSTCYDLKDTRAEIEQCLSDMNHELLLSDRNTFPVDPSIHRHDVCLANIELSDLFIIVIDKRYGSPYYQDQSISITHAELRQALKLNKPILAFVRQSAWDERLTYLRNKKVNVIIEPAHVDKLEVFGLIGEIQNCEKGIWMQPFMYSTDIKEFLKKMKLTEHSIINDEDLDHFENTLSDSATQFVIENGDKSDLNSNEKMAELVKLIPSELGIFGPILAFEDMPPSNPYISFFPLRVQEEGEIVVGIRPTALGLSVKKEIINFIR